MGKNAPNFIASRLYFCHKWLRFLLRNLGAFPKSMFATDLESTKNCIKVIKEGGIIAMMPEARLSTVGKFEDIQETTYSFIKKIRGNGLYNKNLRRLFCRSEVGKGLPQGCSC